MNRGAPSSYDVIVIGAGVVGAAVARELARFDLRVAVVEASSDVGAGTSKANTAILHTGFDARPGSLEARLVARGHRLLSAYAGEAGIPLERTGALMVAWDEDQARTLRDYQQRADANAYGHSRVIGAAALYKREPHLALGALEALEIPDESIICAFTLPLAFATQAVVNGVDLYLETAVGSVSQDDAGLHVLHCGNHQFACDYLVNAAGLYSDVVDGMLGYERFTITPRRGELIVFDKLARLLVSHVILPVPTEISKGVLIAPTVYGNILLGPTAEDIGDKEDRSSTSGGTAYLMDRARGILPGLLDEQVTAVYTGLRAATESSDYQIHVDYRRRYACLGGVRSTGLTASMAIAEHAVAELAKAGLKLKEKECFDTVRMPYIGEAGVRPYRDPDAIARRADYGRIVCHCEKVTQGEIVDACRGLIPASSLDGLRRRTRALMGRCQGFYCMAEVARCMAEVRGTSVGDVLALQHRS